MSALPPKADIDLALTVRQRLGETGNEPGIGSLSLRIRYVPRTATTAARSASAAAHASAMPRTSFADAPTAAGGLSGSPSLGCRRGHNNAGRWGPPRPFGWGDRRDQHELAQAELRRRCLCRSPSCWSGLPRACRARLCVYSQRPLRHRPRQTPLHGLPNVT